MAKLDRTLLATSADTFRRAHQSLKLALQMQNFLIDTSDSRPHHDMLTVERSTDGRIFGDDVWQVRVSFGYGTSGNDEASRYLNAELERRVRKLLPKLAREIYDETQEHARQVLESSKAKEMLASPPREQTQSEFKPDEDGVMVDHAGRVQGVGYTRAAMRQTAKVLEVDAGSAETAEKGARLRVFADDVVVTARGSQSADWLRDRDPEFFDTYFPPRQS